MSEPRVIFPAGDLEAAIAEFRTWLPGWWFTVGSCHLSADASCAPDRNSPDLALIEEAGGRTSPFDAGFHFDDRRPGATLANSLRVVMLEAISERRRRLDALDAKAREATQ